MKKRSQIETQYKWKVEDIFTSDKEWEDAFERAKTYLPKILEYKGKLSNPKYFLPFYLLSDEFDLLVEKLYLYLGCKLNVDITNATYNEMSDKLGTFMVKVQESTSFVSVEQGKIKDKYLDKMLKDEKYQAYKRVLIGIKRNKHLLLSEKEEKLIAGTSSFAGGYSTVFDCLDSSDLTFAKAQDSKGKLHEVTHSSYSSLIESKDRVLRKNAFESMYQGYKQFSNTIATNYINNVYADWYYDKIRKFSSCLESSLYGNNIPTIVYEKLLSNVEKMLPLLHEYYALVKQQLGLKDFSYYDVYVSPCESLDSKVSYEEMVEIGLDALKVLGEDYTGVIREGVRSRWVDVMPNQNKTTGAYQTSAYGVHPYVLLNFDGRKSYTSTFVHEMGHAMHSYLADGTQKYHDAGYSIFVAEVASTVNEILLNHYWIQHAKTKKEKAY